MYALKTSFTCMKNILTTKSETSSILKTWLFLKKSFLSKISWDELFIEYDDVRQHKKFQKKLSNLEKRDLRLEAIRLDQTKKLSAIYVGRAGLKIKIKRKMALFLERNSFAKIQLVPTCDKDQYELKKSIEDQMDCAMVYQYGYIMIFYREKGLPISKNLLPVAKRSTLRDEQDEDDDLFA